MILGINTELPPAGQIKQLEEARETIQRRLNEEKDSFFIYGMVKQIEEIDKEIATLSQSDKQIFHVRVELALPGGDHHPMFSFYNVIASDKDEAGVKAQKAFVEEFKISTIKNTKVGYVWDAGIHVDTNKIPAI